MSFTPKNWISEADHEGPPAVPPGTPISAAALEDLETRLSDYTDDNAPVFSAVHIGADPSGASDSAAEINTALIAASAVDGTVLLEPGTFRLDSVVELPSNVRLVGMGMGKTTLLSNTGTTCPVINDDTVNGNSDIEVRDLTIDGNNESTTDFCLRVIGYPFSAVDACTDILIENVEMKNQGFGLQFFAVTRGTVRGCYIHDMDRDGMQLADSADLVVSGNRCFDLGDDAIALWGDNAVQRRCVVVGNHTGDLTTTGIHNGVAVGGCHKVTVIGNTMKGGYAGVLVSNFNDNSAEDVTVIGNTMEQPGAVQVGSGIGVRIAGGFSDSGTADAGVSGVTVIGNVMHSPHGTGVAVTSGSTAGPVERVIIANNTINFRDGEPITTATGMTITNSAAGRSVSDIQVTGNDINLAPSHGIFLDGYGTTGGFARINIQGNTVRNSAQETASASGIRVVSNGTTAIDRLWIANNRCTDSQGSKTQAYGLSLGGSGMSNVVHTGNDFTGNLTGSISDADNVTMPVITSGATIALPSAAPHFYLAGSTAVSTITATHRGQRVTLFFLASVTLTDASGNLRLAGDFAGTDGDTIELLCDGTNWHEIGRSDNG